MASLRHRLARLPIRLRLTVWYGVLLACVLVLFGVAFWIGLRISLAGAFDDQLREQAALTLTTVHVQDGSIAFDPEASAAARRGGAFVRLLDHNGRVIADTSPAFGAVPLNEKDISAALDGETRFTSVRIGRRPIRIITVPVPRSDGTSGVLQVGMPRSELDEVIHDLLGAFLFAAPAAGLVSLVGGYLLARQALAPVAAITRLAAGIGGGGDLHARLNLDLPNDELGNLAATFDAMLGRIAEAFDRQRRFTGDAAHELRTPLALMRGRIDLARSRPRTTEEHLATLAGLDSDLGRLSGVVGALLVLARSDAGRLAVAREPFDLAVTVGRVADQYAETAAAVGVAIRVETVPTPFVGDEDLLVQVLVNLVDNAFAHTPLGGTVTLGCGPGRAAIRLWVADTGSGIAPEYQARVFDRFYRIDTGRARGAGGVGLGLSTCRAIIEAHGGTITLTSGVGQGTCVEAILPKPLPAETNARPG
ncbi:MAG TPA: ATP-binding protein [Thermomicrobiales bacterium]|nr:ATP-binding protein [Thermomicrobiales bacterium]